MEDNHQGTTNKTDDQSWSGCDIDAAKTLETCNDTAIEPRTSGLQATSDGLELTMAGNTYTIDPTILAVIGLAVIAGLVMAAVLLNRSHK